MGYNPNRSPDAPPDSYRHLTELLENQTQGGGAASFRAERMGDSATRHLGRTARDPASAGTGPETLFLVASLTKPVVAAAAVILVENGLLTMDDRVGDLLPRFAQNGKSDVRLRHLLTHTSGLPDMPPNNRELRARHEPIERFVEEVERSPLAFQPGTAVAYQSMGFLALAGVIRAVSGLPCAEFLRREVFEPFGMTETSLGARAGTHHRIAEIHLEPDQEGTDWHWNTPYWLDFGAPWGGLVTTADDYAKFCRSFLMRGSPRILSDAGVRAMTTNQLDGFPSISDEERRCTPWGFGWRLHWPGRSDHFGDLLGPRAFGHWGATGTLCWVDPDASAFFVLLTTEPAGEHGRHLAVASNAAAAALTGRPLFSEKVK